MATCEGVGVMGKDEPERQKSLTENPRVVGAPCVSHWKEMIWVMAADWNTVAPPLAVGGQAPVPPHQSWNSIPARGMLSWTQVLA